MPLYDFLCPDCHELQEVLVRSASARPACRSCGGKKLERQVSGFAVGGQARVTGRDRAQQVAAANPGLCGRCGMTPGSCASGPA